MRGGAAIFTALTMFAIAPEPATAQKLHDYPRFPATRGGVEDCATVAALFAARPDLRPPEANVSSNLGGVGSSNVSWDDSQDFHQDWVAEQFPALDAETARDLGGALAKRLATAGSLACGWEPTASTLHVSLTPPAYSADGTHALIIVDLTRWPGGDAGIIEAVVTCMLQREAGRWRVVGCVDSEPTYDRWP